MFFLPVYKIQKVFVVFFFILLYSCIMLTFVSKRVFLTVALFFSPLFFLLAAVPTEPVIDHLRDLVYEQELSAGEIYPVYQNTLEKINEKYGQSASGLAFSSRIEYFMGRVYQYEENSKDAISHYEKGFEYAEDSLKLETSVLALLMKSECISQMCALKPVSYAMANGLKVGSLADEVLNIDSQNTAALYLKAARYIYAPKIFADQKKGRKMLLEGLETMPYFPPDDEFNFNLAMGYSYIQTKDKEEALEYLDKALEVYPSNKYCKTLMEEAGKLR